MAFYIIGKLADVLMLQDIVLRKTCMPTRQKKPWHFELHYASRRIANSMCSIEHTLRPKFWFANNVCLYKEGF